MIPGLEVGISDIPKALQNLWSGNDAAAKASLINICIYSERHGSMEENTALIEAIARQHACRALVVFAKPDAGNESKARAWITVHCQFDPSGMRRLCSEQIAFEIGGNCPSLLRNIVFANLDSDLPLVLWWQGEIGNSLDDSLLSRIDRLIVDSSSWAQPSQSLRAVDEKLQIFRENQELVLHDMSWTRGHDLRVAISQTFDDCELQNALPHMNELAIWHGKDNGIAAELLAAWVSRVLSLDPGAVMFHGNSSGEEPLTRLDLSSEEVRLSWQRKGGRWECHGRINATGRKIQLLFPASPSDSASLVNQQLSRGGANQLLQKVLPVFFEKFAS